MEAGSKPDDEEDDGGATVKSGPDEDAVLPAVVPGREPLLLFPGWLAPGPAAVGVGAADEPISEAGIG